MPGQVSQIGDRQVAENVSAKNTCHLSKKNKTRELNKSVFLKFTNVVDYLPE